MSYLLSFHPQVSLNSGSGICTRRSGNFALIARRIPHAHGLVDHCKTPLPPIPHQQHLPDHHLPLLVVIPPPLLPVPPASMNHQRPSGQDCVDTAGSQGIMLALALINNFFFVCFCCCNTTYTSLLHALTYSQCLSRSFVFQSPHSLI